MAITDYLQIETEKPNKNNGSSSTVDNHIWFHRGIDEAATLWFLETLAKLNRDLHHQQINFGLPDPIPIHLHTQSGGGYLTSSLSMYDAIAASRSPVIAHVTGLVASGGTLMIMSASKRIMQPNAFMLIHELRGVVWGPMHKMEEQVGNMRVMMRKIKDIYRHHSKIPTNVLNDLLKQDLLLTATKCLHYGLVDEIAT